MNEYLSGREEFPMNQRFMLREGKSGSIGGFQKGGAARNASGILKKKQRKSQKI